MTAPLLNLKSKRLLTSFREGELALRAIQREERNYLFSERHHSLLVLAAQLGVALVFAWRSGLALLPGALVFLMGALLQVTSLRWQARTIIAAAASSAPISQVTPRTSPSGFVHSGTAATLLPAAFGGLIAAWLTPGREVFSASSSATLNSTVGSILLFLLGAMSSSLIYARLLTQIEGATSEYQPKFGVEAQRLAVETARVHRESNLLSLLLLSSPCVLSALGTLSLQGEGLDRLTLLPGLGIVGLGFGAIASSQNGKDQWLSATDSIAGLVLSVGIYFLVPGTLFTRISLSLFPLVIIVTQAV
ncbi:MAG: hypothetical protein MK135_03120, partial [Polyangiaceae bacterium]|nr:hypothetical protein [Polyangiaceae bacterium]